MLYLGLETFGGFAYRGRTLEPATRPWITDLSVLCPYPSLEAGNIPEFEADPDWANWCLTDSPNNHNARLRWHKFKDRNHKFFVADRMLLTRVSWLDLDERGFVSGADVEIDGRLFRCRLLSGGHTSKSNAYQGASTANEWDMLLSGQYSGSPTPRKEDSSEPLSPRHLESSHNSFWNWFAASSWTAEHSSSRTDGRICRGYHGPTFFYENTIDHRHEDIGWRPVLEAL